LTLRGRGTDRCDDVAISAAPRAVPLFGREIELERLGDLIAGVHERGAHRGAGRSSKTT
jgi:hypothetical protein